MLLYSLLHLTGYALPIDELKRFRQLGSKTAGHPEYGYAPGVETTTGPLGQGIANGVGMALAEKLLAAQFNRPDLELIDHHTYVFMGDGCMMEGLSHEVCAFAGTLGLGKLIAFYDDNGISIDSEKGKIADWYTDDVPKRFAAYHWQVIPNVDGHDVEAVDRAIRKAKREKDRPTLICCKTIIAKGAPKKANTGAAHGAPLGPEEIAATRQAIGWPYPPFEVPSNVYEAWDAKEAGKRAERRWNRTFKEYEKQFPAEAAELTRRTAGQLPVGFDKTLQALVEDLNAKAETIATRKASQNVLEALTPGLPELLGGSADLTGSNLTMVKASKPVSAASVAGNHIFYGVREFGMCAIMNGITLHGGFVPYGGTFLVFSDYARNALRMAALMKIRVVYVFTHDSIGLGEDGPTHQPVEHAATLRLIPNMDVWRPCDTVETAVAWGAALERTKGPTALLLSRQNLPFARKPGLENIARGAYVLSDAPSGPAEARAVIIATGSEVQLALGAQKLLAEAGIPVRVVSMPSSSVFDRQPDDYRKSVLLEKLPRVAVEAGVTDFWRKYVGLEGAVVGLDRFGESAPAGDLFKHFGFTPENVAKAVRSTLS
jgi:transketolase